jgi:hypothetical protein
MAELQPFRFYFLDSETVSENQIILVPEMFVSTFNLNNCVMYKTLNFYFVLPITNPKIDIWGL